MKNIPKLFVLFIVIVFYTSCNGQNQINSPNDNIKSEIKDTISSFWSKNDTVVQIRKGSNGTILIASKRNVFRYDGKSFFNLSNKLGSHRYQDVLEDRKGGLWFATEDSGVYYYNGKSFQHFTINEGLADNWATCIYEDKVGVIWLGTKGGASRYDGKKIQNFLMKGEYKWDTYITTFMEDKTGKLWVSARGDVFNYDGNNFITIPNNGNRVYDVFSIIEDSKGNIWFGGWDGLRRFDGKTFTKFEHNTGYSNIIEDKKGNIWTSGKLKGAIWALSRYEQRYLQDKDPIVSVIMSGPNKGTYSGILEANDGSIWFGHNSGLYRYYEDAITDFGSKN